MLADALSVHLYSMEFWEGLIIEAKEKERKSRKAS